MSENEDGIQGEAIITVNEDGGMTVSVKMPNGALANLVAAHLIGPLAIAIRKATEHQGVVTNETLSDIVSGAREEIEKTTGKPTEVVKSTDIGSLPPQVQAIIEGMRSQSASDENLCDCPNCTAERERAKAVGADPSTRH